MWEWRITMTIEQTIMVWVTEADMFIVSCLPWLLIILIMFLCWVGIMIWIGHRQ